MATMALSQTIEMSHFARSGCTYTPSTESKLTTHFGQGFVLMDEIIEIGTDPKMWYTVFSNKQFFLSIGLLYLLPFRG